MGGDKKTMTLNEEQHDRQWYIQKGIDENHGNLLIFGGMYTGYLWISVMYTVLSVFHVPLLILAAYLCRHDFVVFSEVFHLLIILLLAFITFAHFLFQREKIDRIFETIGRNFYDYGNTIDSGSKKRIAKVQKESDRRKWLLKHMFYCGICCSALSISVFRPLLQYYLQKYIIVRKLPDGVNGTKNTFIYYPWDPSMFWVNLFAWFLQDVYTFITVCVANGYSLVFFYTGESMIVQLETLIVTLKRVKKRADYVTKQNSRRLEAKNKEYRKVLQSCLNQSVNHHQVIIKFFEDYKAINYLTLLWLVVGITFLLCMLAVLFVSDASLVTKVPFALFLGSEVLLIFLQCWYGEWIAGISADLSWVLYNADWYKYSADFLQYHKMISMRCTRPLHLTAGGFTNISRNTFLEVIRTAFSYSNLMQASNSRAKVGSD